MERMGQLNVCVCVYIYLYIFEEVSQRVQRRQHKSLTKLVIRYALNAEFRNMNLAWLGIKIKEKVVSLLINIFLLYLQNEVF